MLVLFVRLRQNFYHKDQVLTNILEFFPLYLIFWK